MILVMWPLSISTVITMLISTANNCKLAFVHFILKVNLQLYMCETVKREPFLKPYTWGVVLLLPSPIYPVTQCYCYNSLITNILWCVTRPTTGRLVGHPLFSPSHKCTCTHTHAYTLTHQYTVDPPAHRVNWIKISYM